MRGEISSIYNAIIVSLIIGIIITIVVLFITFEPEEHFTEIYFEDHEDLPEKVKLNNDYEFSFTIHSLENSSKAYDYESKAELYNLYDITEGTYRCLGKFRDKIRLKWELGELIDNNTYLTIKNLLNDNKNNELIKNAYTKTVGGFHLEKIEWDKYDIDFSYRTIDGLGQISLVFIDETGNNKYALILSESKNKILFVKFDNNEVRIKKRDYELEPGKGYRVIINFEKTNADIYVNDVYVFNIKDINLKNVKIGFETRNTYAYIRPLRVFKYNYNLKDSSTIKTYDFDENVVTQEHNKLRDRRIDYLKLKTFPDEYRSLLFDNVYKWMNLNYDEKSDYNLSFKIKSYENKDSEVINWINYIFGYDYETIEGEGKITALFEDLHGNLKYAFMIDEKNNKAFFLRTIDKKIKINKKTISIKSNEKHNVKIKVDRNHVKIYFNDKSIFDISDLIDYTNGKIGFELKNTNALFKEVYVQNEDINYSDPTVYIKYKKKYSIKKSELVEAKINLIQKKEVFTSPVPVKETYVEDLFDKADIENDVVVSQDLNPNIPSKSMVFDGYNARILDWTDYVFTFSYTALDGEKEIINSFQNLNGKDKYSFLISEKTNDILFTNHENGDKARKNIDMQEDSWHTVRLEVNKDNAKYYFDGRLVFHLINVDFTTGQFSLGTQSTNAHFRRVFAINNDGQKKVYKIQEDPCELQKIGEVMLDQGNIVLDADKKITKTQTLNIDQLFDFAKVSVNVDDREIHFWVSSI